MGIRYIYERTNLSVQEKDEILGIMSASSGKKVWELKKKLLNIILSRSDGKKLEYNYPYLYDCFSPSRYTRWIYKYATTKLLNTIYFLDIFGYQRFVEESRKSFKFGNNKTHERINFFLDEIDLHNYVLEILPDEWWMDAFKHCLERDDSRDLVLKLVNKMHLFGLSALVFEEMLNIFILLTGYEDTKERLEYLTYFNVGKKTLLFLMEHTSIWLEGEWFGTPWICSIIENKEYFGLQEEDFQRENLEDMLLDKDFVDNLVDDYIRITSRKSVE